MGQKIDLTGKKFGKITVLEESEKRDASGAVCWLCQCECGTIKIISGSTLRKGSTQSCGCLKKEKVSQACSKNLIGQRFGLLTVIEKTDNRSSGSIIWRCKCDCGNECYIKTGSLTTGATKSCGCLSKLNLTNKKFGKLIAIKPTEKRERSSVIWECKCECGKICYVSSSNLKSGGVKSCGCLNTSMGEEKIKQILIKSNISFEREKSFKTCKFETNRLARFDFFVNNKYLIEFDGQQHFLQYNGYGNDLKNIQKRDHYKNQWCKENNIPLIRIPYTHLNELCLEDLLLETSKYIITDPSNP